jgi:hypothetical protein
MAKKKKAAIGDLIKSDMSRRAIGEEPKPVLAEGVPASNVPAGNAPAGKAPVTSAARPVVSEGIAGFAAFIDGQARSVGLTDETDLATFYDFLQGQAARYFRGFDAGRRFHG